GAVRDPPAAARGSADRLLPDGRLLVFHERRISRVSATALAQPARGLAGGLPHQPNQTWLVGSFQRPLSTGTSSRMALLNGRNRLGDVLLRRRFLAAIHANPAILVRPRRADVQIQVLQKNRPVPVAINYDKAIWSGLSWGVGEVKGRDLKSGVPIVVRCVSLEQRVVELTADVYLVNYQ